jgi:Zn-dependent metalloprotease
MFAYDYDRADATIGEDRPIGPGRNWANPNAIMRDGQPYPDHMSEYDPTPPDDSPHFNSTILSHAYYLFVQRVGHTKAGRVLHNVPQRLSPHPTFQQLRAAFSQSAHAIYGGTVAAHAIGAFTAVGLAPPPQESDCGPRPC